MLRPKPGFGTERELLSQIDLQDVALRWAARVLDEDEKAWHAAQSVGIPLLPARELASCPMAVIVTLWAEQRFQDEFRAIADATRSGALSRYLVNLFDVPPLVIESTGAERLDAARDALRSDLAS